MSDAPIASFGMPVFNGELYLERAIESLLAQTFADFKLVISDNGSEDRSPEIANTFARKDSRVTVLTSTVNHGAAWNFQQVFRASEGQYFAWTAADDYWEPEFLESCLTALEAHPQAVACVTGIQPVSSDGSPMGEPYEGLCLSGGSARSRWRAALRNSLLHAATYGLMRREALERTRLILPYIGTDHVVMAELALQGDVIEVPATLSYKLVPGEGELYRSHADALGHLGGDARTPWFLWARMTKELVLGASHVRPDGCSVVQLSLDAVTSYFLTGGCVNDVKQTILRFRPLH